MTEIPAEHKLVELRQYSQELVSELLKVYAKINNLKETTEIDRR